MGKESQTNFEVIIPVVNIDLANLLMASIEKNTLKPKRVIIINNSESKPIPIKLSSHFPIDVYHSTTGLVNESLNIGISMVSEDCDYVSILNDDIILGDWFFDRILKTFNKFPDCGVALPLQVFDLKHLVQYNMEYIPVSKREGPAMTIKKSVLDHIPPIPSALKIFFGDDWIWVWTVYNLSKYWYKDVGNTIYHAVGSTVRTLKYNITHLRKERIEWYKIKAGIL